jgi:hypothetical protein
MERQGWSTIPHSAVSNSQKSSITNVMSTTMILVLSSCRESQSMIMIGMSYAKTTKKMEEES